MSYAAFFFFSAVQLENFSASFQIFPKWGFSGHFTDAATL